MIQLEDILLIWLKKIRNLYSGCYLIFSMYCMDVSMKKMVCRSLACRFGTLFLQPKTRTSGWSIVNLEVVQLLLQAWRVCTEDLDECNGAPLEHAAGATHLLDDVRRFGQVRYIGVSSLSEKWLGLERSLQTTN